MSILLLPMPAQDEGFSGFKMRVAEANLLPYAWIDGADLRQLEDEAETREIYLRWTDLMSTPAVCVQRRTRWCPGCLGRTGYFRLGWELLFADACPACGHWLLDKCCDCGEPMTWRRDAFARCNCGSNLCEQPSAAAPSAVISLSQTMEHMALGSAHNIWPHLVGITLAQCTRLVRVLGAYGSGRNQRATLKIAAADTLDVSWTISSMAAEILANWPNGFHTFLAAQSTDAEGRRSDGKMPSVFGGFYRALYKVLPDAEFGWMRRAFEDHITEHWSGAAGRRNRRLPASVLSRMAWLPSSEATSQLGISKRRLVHLIDTGILQARQRLTASGREFWMVRRDDVEALSRTEIGEVSLIEASAQLGIKRQRLSRLLPRICPGANKVTLQGTPWLIPKSWVQGWNALITGLPVLDEQLTDVVSLDHLLRYGPLDEVGVARLITDISSGQVRPVGRCEGLVGIASLVVKRQEVEGGNGQPGHELMTVSAAAESLGVKQEVAYALVRLGLLESELVQAGRRQAQGISTSAVLAFRSSYVLAAELARGCGRSSRALIEALASDGVEPVAGPAQGTCRQVVYRRADLVRANWLTI